MGGIGRTGLFMGCVAKVMLDYDAEWVDGPLRDPVTYVRHYYKPSNGHVAIETAGQQQYVGAFDTAEAVTFLKDCQREQFMRRLVSAETAMDELAEKASMISTHYANMSFWRRLQFLFRGI